MFEELTKLFNSWMESNQAFASTVFSGMIIVFIVAFLKFIDP